MITYSLSGAANSSSRKPLAGDAAAQVVLGGKKFLFPPRIQDCRRLTDSVGRPCFPWCTRSHVPWHQHIPPLIFLPSPFCSISHDTNSSYKSTPHFSIFRSVNACKIVSCDAPKNLKTDFENKKFKDFCRGEKRGALGLS